MVLFPGRVGWTAILLWNAQLAANTPIGPGPEGLLIPQAICDLNKPHEKNSELLKKQPVYSFFGRLVWCCLSVLKNSDRAVAKQCSSSSLFSMVTWASRLPLFMYFVHIIKPCQPNNWKTYYAKSLPQCAGLSPPRSFYFKLDTNLKHLLLTLSTESLSIHFLWDDCFSVS